MTKDKISTYTNLISSANRSQLICILFDIYFTYIDEARDSIERDNQEYVDSIKNAENVLLHLKDSLDFNYEIAANLYSIYDYVNRALATAIYKKDIAIIDEASRHMRELADAFAEVAKTDNSEPLMKNSQGVMAGLTYSGSELNESYDTGNRGFLV